MMLDTHLSGEYEMVPLPQEEPRDSGVLGPWEGRHTHLGASPGGSACAPRRCTAARSTSTPSSRE